MTSRYSPHFLTLLHPCHITSKLQTVSPLKYFINDHNLPGCTLKNQKDKYEYDNTTIEDAAAWVWDRDILPQVL